MKIKLKWLLQKGDRFVSALMCQPFDELSVSVHKQGAREAANRVTFINTLRPRQNGRHFPDDILKWIFFNENVWISIEISLKFVPKGDINNIPVLVEIMVWRRPGDKPLSEPMMVNLLTHTCVTRPQWVNYYQLMYISNHLIHSDWDYYTYIYSSITFRYISTWCICSWRTFVRACGPEKKSIFKYRLRSTLLHHTGKLNLNNIVADALELCVTRPSGNNPPIVPHICVGESGQHWFR